MSVFARYEGIGADTSGTTFGLSMDFNKVPMVNMGIHGAWTQYAETSGLPSVGVHAGLRF